jgi:K+-transporting ATPase ATPase A chain
MTIVGWLQISLLFLAVLAAIKPLGLYMARVFSGERTFLSPVLAPVEVGLYRMAGIQRDKEQGWLAYTVSMLAFSLAGFLALYAILRLQAYLPLNPQGFAGMAPDLAFNTAVSFVTNTNWQNYAGETTLGHFAQMAGLPLPELPVGCHRHGARHRLQQGLRPLQVSTLGNFWVDMTRATL